MAKTTTVGNGTLPGMLRLWVYCFGASWGETILHYTAEQGLLRLSDARQGAEQPKGQKWWEGNKQLGRVERETQKNQGLRLGGFGLGWVPYLTTTGICLIAAMGSARIAVAK